MAYYDVAELSGDSQFINRVAACYAIETGGSAQNPQTWAMEHNWEMAAQPGFGDAYTYARANDNPNPGADPAVITDNQILSAVQSILNKETP
jgi:hypothetical protein